MELLPLLNDSMFEAPYTFNRNRAHWEAYQSVRTPVQVVYASSPWGKGSKLHLLFKRNDLFAPLGFGGVNGAKMMQMLHLIQGYREWMPNVGARGLIYAGSVKSPQLARVAALAKHFEMPCTLIIGSDPQTAQKNNPNVRIAAMLGATFLRASAPYNPVLQKTAKDLHKLGHYKSHLLLEYALSVEGSNERIKEFYDAASKQVLNVPHQVDTLLVPCGSGNTTIAVLTGIALNAIETIKRVVLFGVGPARIEWFEERIRMLDRYRYEGALNGSPGNRQSVGARFVRSYPGHEELAEKYNKAFKTFSPGNAVQQAYGPPIRLEYIDLHGTGFAKYEDEMPRQVAHIPLYGTYEGKMWAYMEQHREQFEPLLTSGRTLFWIVGGAQSPTVMAAADAADRLR